jgi:hypothetical protein
MAALSTARGGLGQGTQGKEDAAQWLDQIGYGDGLGRYGKKPCPQCQADKKETMASDPAPH